MKEINSEFFSAMFRYKCRHMAFFNAREYSKIVNGCVDDISLEDMNVSRKDFGAKPFSYPQPVWIIGTYDENGNGNSRWMGFICMWKDTGLSWTTCFLCWKSL